MKFITTSLFFGSAAAFSLDMMKAGEYGAGLNRREIVDKTLAILGSAATAIISTPAISNAYSVPDLTYNYEALEPSIDSKTMTIHHDKHHATYVANLNKARDGKSDVPIVDLMADALEAGPAIRNNGGGHYNHAFFWAEMAPPDKAKSTKPSKQLTGLIKKSFGSMDVMKEKFEKQAAPGAVFGSGWVWVCVNRAGNKLEIVGTPNQDNPLMKGVIKDQIMIPILGLDVWEHAYYLKYQNRRTEYVSNWWNVVDWDKVSANCKYAVEKHAGVPMQG